MPFSKVNEWLAIEKTLTSASPDRIVLATAGANGIPHARIVAIREITAKGVLFFTQKGTRKITEIAENPYASMTLWLPSQQREVMLDGKIEKLSAAENDFYWQTRTKDRQLHFLAYAPTSGQPIQSTQLLETRWKSLTEEYKEQDVPLPETYLGYRLVPETYVFYTLIDLGFSEVVKFRMQDGEWISEVLSP